MLLIKLNSFIKPNKKYILFSFICFTLILIIWWLVIAPFSFNYADGGYLWTGAWLTSLGEIPKLHFKGYDLFRYYWLSVFLYCLGNHWYSVLWGALLSALIPITILALLAFKPYFNKFSKIDVMLFLLFILLESFWLFPAHKLFEHGISVLLILITAKFISSPSLKNYFYFGLFLAFAAMVGRNHLVYSGFCFILTMLLINEYKELTKEKASLLFLGFFIGYLPQLYLFVFVDDYFTTYLNRSVLDVINRDGLNLKKTMIPVWSSVLWSGNKSIVNNSLLLLSLLQSFILLVSAVAIAMLIKARKNISQIQHHHYLYASIVVLIPYLHHAFSRADLSHLSQSIQPIIFFLFLLFFLSRKIGVMMLFCFSLLSLLVWNNSYLFFIENRMPKVLKVLKFNNEKVKTINKIKGLVDKVNQWVLLAKKQKRVIDFLPDIPVFYAINRIKPNLYNTFVLRNQKKQYQLEEIKRLENSDFIVLGRGIYNKKNDFNATNPLIYKYIETNYCVQDVFNNYQLYGKCQ